MAAEASLCQHALPMQLHLSDDQELLRSSFAQLLAAESTPARVRAAEPVGFDPALWRHLAETDALGMRVDTAKGGGGQGLFEATLVAEEVGRRLASGPILEAIVAAGLLSAVDDPRARDWLDRVLRGDAIVTFALHDTTGRPQLVPGGAIADAALGLDGGELVLVPLGDTTAPTNLGAAALAEINLSTEERIVLLCGDAATDAHARAREEWKLLTAAALGGLAREALEIAARYATERIQFGRPIGAFQGIAHPLADSAAEVEGVRGLVSRAIWSIAHDEHHAAGLISMASWWSAHTATAAVARALHTHGGYGLSLEYDIQLYHRRGKAWALLAGDPQEELGRVADRLWTEADVPLPDAGAVTLDWTLGPKAIEFGETAERFFESTLTDDLRAKARYGWEGHDVGFHKQLAAAGLLFPAWPSRYGGQDRDAFEMKALQDVFTKNKWTRNPIGVTNIVGRNLMRFGTDELKNEVLPRLASGDAIVSLGYTEPGSGSDVADARTRAERDGDGWIVNGQKMFTSGADIAQYVFLLTRTNPEAEKKHKGLTLFLVPTHLQGLEIQPLHTLSDERTNITYYADVRVPDRYRVGEVDGGWDVMRYALQLEHGAGFHLEQWAMLDAALEWARTAQGNDGVALDDARVRERLARVAVHAEVSFVLGRRALWAGVQGLGDHAAGPMAKLFSAESFIGDAADLMDLTAPQSLLTSSDGPGFVEASYRLAAATSIYGGTSEIMRSIIAQASLGLPRSRS
ncbi:MAG: acyl-CoA dehydrogenase [Candidatus Binatia bacterium]|nr:acyl-CoA dehydrogenase [Candidatus Binatia bacterium]